MHIYNYIHIWRAARSVKNPPANNYGLQGAGQLMYTLRAIQKTSTPTYPCEHFLNPTNQTWRPVLLFSKLNKMCFGYFDPGNIFLDNDDI